MSSKYNPANVDKCFNEDPSPELLPISEEEKQQAYDNIDKLVQKTRDELTN
jgi:hypothetical protein